MKRSSILLLALALLTAASAAAQTPTSPCSDPDKSHQFDFWIGDWEVESGGAVAGTNRIEPILDGCVLQENWVGTQSAGTSINFYDPRAGVWRQYWVYRSGLPLVLEGGLEDGKMVLTGQTVNQAGQTVDNRVTWTPNADGTVRQLWQQSSDGGATWTDAFDGLYKRRE